MRGRPARLLAGLVVAAATLAGIAGAAHADVLVSDTEHPDAATTGSAAFGARDYGTGADTNGQAIGGVDMAALEDGDGQPLLARLAVAGSDATAPRLHRAFEPAVRHPPRPWRDRSPGRVWRGDGIEAGPRGGRPVAGRGHGGVGHGGGPCLLLQRGAFGAHAVAGTAAALAAYTGAVPAWMLLRSLGAVCFARGDTATPVVAGLGAALVNLVLSLALMSPLGHVGIALATSVAVWLQSGFLAVSLARRGALVPDRRLYARVGACAAASAFMAGVLWLARLGLGATADAGGFERIVELGVLVAAGLGCFAAAVLATGAVRWRELTFRAAVGK